MENKVVKCCCCGRQFVSYCVPVTDKRLVNKERAVYLGIDRIGCHECTRELDALGRFPIEVGRDLF